MTFGLSEKQAAALRQLESDGVQYCLYGGSAGGGKSVLGCAWQIARRMKHPKSSGIIIRQTRKDIYSTVMVTFHKVAAIIFGEDMVAPYKLNEQKDEIQFHNGSIIYLREGRFMPQDPQYDRLKLEVMDGWIEEGTQVDERAFIAIRPRIRQMHGGAEAKLLITSNPGPGWVKHRFIKGIDDKAINLQAPYSFIQAKVMDNPDKVFAVNYAKALSDLDPITKAMYLDGNWDVNINENPFFWAYNRAKHTAISEPETQPNHSWLLSFDFNVDPCTLIVATHKMPYGKIGFIDHISANQFTEHNASPLEAVCRIFTRKYITSGKCLPTFITVTGDAAGKAGSADRVAARDFYDTIKRELRLSPSQIKVPKANPPHTFSRELCNHALSKLGEGLLTFTNDCSKLTAEIQSAFPDDNGTLNKAKKEQGLHALDAWRYAMHYLFKFDKYKSDVEIWNRFAK